MTSVSPKLVVMMVRFTIILSTGLFFSRLDFAINGCAMFKHLWVLWLSQLFTNPRKAAFHGSTVIGTSRHQIIGTALIRLFGVIVVLIASIDPFQGRTPDINRKSSRNSFLTFVPLLAANKQHQLKPVSHITMCKAYSGNSKVQKKLAAEIQTVQQVNCNQRLVYRPAAAPSIRNQLCRFQKHLYHK